MERYLRQITIPEIGAEGQRRIAQASVLIVGLGGLGSPAAQYLAGAGVGRLGLLDRDTVTLSNLHRQVLYTEEEIGLRKTDCAAARLQALNRTIAIKPFPVSLTKENADTILRPFDIIVDATDSFETKYLLNDVCCALKKTLIHGGAMGVAGQVMTVMPGSACLRCFMAEPPAEAFGPDNPRPILGPLAGLIGTVQAIEVVKCIVGSEDVLRDTVLFVDGTRFLFKRHPVARDPHCRACGKKVRV